MTVGPGVLPDTLGAAAPGLLRYARSLTRDAAAAEDLVQETLLRALQHADTFRGEASLATWLRRILHNAAVDAARRARDVPVGDLLDDGTASAGGVLDVEAAEQLWRQDAYTVDPALVAERAESAAELEDALVRLPSIYRSAVILHDVEGFTMREVAGIQGIKLPAAKQRLRRGRMALVSALAAGAERRAVLRGVPLSCWDARQWVSDYLDGELDVAVRAAVEAHLRTCPTCPPLYAALVGVHARLGALRDPDAVVPEALGRRIEAMLVAHRVSEAAHGAGG